MWYVIYITKENQYAGFSGPSRPDQLLFLSSLPFLHFFKMQILLCNIFCNVLQITHIRKHSEYLQNSAKTLCQHPLFYCPF